MIWLVIWCPWESGGAGREKYQVNNFCGALVGREEVGAEVILLRVGYVTLGCILRSAQLALLDRR